MSYKTIVVHVGDEPNAGACYAHAAELAQVEQAGERGADLLLGGATRTVLKPMTLPVFMAA